MAAAPKSRGSSKKRYYSNYLFIKERNALRRKHRHQRAVLAEKHKRMEVARGSARRERRLDIVAFRAKQRQHRQQFTGTIKVNAPGLQMLNQYVGAVGLQEGAS
jgi:hypothetical protein